MPRTKAHFILAALLLAIFSIGTFHDVCAQNEWKGSPSDATSFSSESAASASPSNTEKADCHCMCHFSFQPVNFISLEGYDLHQSLASTIKEITKEPHLNGVFRPPISLL